MSNFFTLVMKYKQLTLVAICLLVMMTALGLPKLKFNTDYHVFFDDDNPELMEFDAIQRQFVKNDNVMIMISPKDGDVFQSSVIDVIWKMTNESWNIPYSSRVDSLSNFQYSEAIEDDLIIRDLIPNKLKLTPENLQLIKKQALGDPDLVHRLISKNGQYTAIFITLNLPRIGDSVLTKEVMNGVKAMLEKNRSENSHLQFYVSGVVPMDYAFEEVSMKDGQQLIPLSLLIMMIILYMIFRSFVAVCATLLVVFLSIIMAMGLAGWLGIALTPPSASAPLVILTLAIADCIHFIASFHKASNDGVTKEEALRFAFINNRIPIILTSLTSTIGFLGMNFSESPPFRDLGNITALGIMFACLLSLILVPIFLSFFKAPTSFSRGLIAFDKYLHKLINAISARPYQVLIGGGIIVLTLVSFARLNQIDDTFLKYFDESVQFRSDSDKIEQNLTGQYFIDYAINSKKLNGIYNVNFLKTTEEFIQWLELQPEVIHVSSLINVLKRLNKNLHQDDPNFYHLPNNSEEAAQYILLYEMSLPYGLDLKNQMSFDKSALRISATLSTIPTQQVLAFEAKVKAWWQQHNNIEVTAGSPTLMFAHIGMRNIHSMLLGTGLALLVISVLMFIILKSIKFGLFSLLPNLAPAFMAFGLWGVFVGEVGLAVSVVAAMSLGIVVDDTIHFLYKYLRLRREDLSVETSLEQTVRQTGTAILTTSCILGVGFGVLSFSDFQVNAQMGLLTAVCIGLAVLLDLIVLPALILVGDKHEESGFQEKENVIAAIPN